MCFALHFNGGTKCIRMTTQLNLIECGVPSCSKKEKIMTDMTVFVSVLRLTTNCRKTWKTIIWAKPTVSNFLMEKIYKFCCICIEETSGLECTIDSDENGLRYSEKLALCDQTQKWDDTTLSLCKQCKDKVNFVYDFIETCKKSEVLRIEKLRQLENEIAERQAENETFTCYICKRVFKKKRSLKAHITRMHLLEDVKKKEKAAKVNEKENSQVNNSNVLDKLHLVKEENGLRNDIKKEFALLDEDKDDDYFNHNDITNYSSDDDDIKPKSQKTVRRKMKRPESFTCEYCGKQFNRHQHWSAHIRSKHTFEKPYKCKLCDASFATSHSLLVHKRNHNNEKPYICSTCGKGFVCSGDLFHHNKIHLNKKEYECNICKKRFNTTSILRTHKIVKHTEPQDWKYVCLLCDRRFPINSGLSLHMKRHTGVKDHSCHICGKKFFNKSELTKHIVSHSNQKRFKCNLCEDKEYKNKEGLNKHMKIIHDVGNWKAPKLEKKYLCPLCPKKFTFNNKLQRHLLTHTGEKPYKCDFCDKKFNDSYYRKNHIRKEHNEQFKEEEIDIKYEDVVTAIPTNGFV